MFVKFAEGINGTKQTDRLIGNSRIENQIN